MFDLSQHLQTRQRDPVFFMPVAPSFNLVSHLRARSNLEMVASTVARLRRFGSGK